METQKPHPGFQPGVMSNPEGTGNLKALALAHKKSRGPNTDLGKLKSIIKRDVIKHGKYLKKKKFRKCDNCPLCPIVIKDKILYRCSYYEKHARCKLDIQDWKIKLKAFFMAEEVGGVDEMMKLVAAESFICAQEAKAGETATKGFPGYHTNEFIKTTNETLNNAGKLAIEREKIGQPQVNQHLHMGEGDFVGKMLEAIRNKK